MSILIAEDEKELRQLLQLNIEKEGYHVLCAKNGREALDLFAENSIELCIFDIMMPELDGFQLVSRIREKSTVPILMLTARGDELDKVISFRLGADDYLSKPCQPDRLLARAGRLLQTYAKVKNVIQCGELSLDTDTYKLILKDRHIILPETEGKILRLLMEKHPQLVSRAELFSAVWGTDDFVDENILQVNMTRLRKNLSKMGFGNIVMTIRGQGYQLEVLDL
jgi:DNA-binding response OmpR family regulator